MKKINRIVDRSFLMNISDSVISSFDNSKIWVHNLGKGRVCCVTPGHYTENIIFKPYLKLLKNAVDWCVK